MTTLILAPDAALGYVRLTITPTAEVTRILRADANGQTDLRTMTGQLPHTVADGDLFLDDYEAAHGTVRYYVLTADAMVTGTVQHVLDTPWLGTPENPQHSAPLRSVEDYGAGGQTLSTVHEPEAGFGPPIVIVRGATSRRGSLRIAAGTYPQALHLLRICQRGQTLMLRQTEHAGMDMYFIPMTFDIVTALAAKGASVFDLTLSYIEVDRPAGALTGALGWTWADVEAEFATWADVEATYASWSDLAVDRRTI